MAIIHNLSKLIERECKIYGYMWISCIIEYEVLHVRHSISITITMFELLPHSFPFCQLMQHWNDYDGIQIYLSSIMKDGYWVVCILLVPELSNTINSFPCQHKACLIKWYSFFSPEVKTLEYRIIWLLHHIGMKPHIYVSRFSRTFNIID